MKVLVYGSGVIGSYLAHVLCTAGNDVTVLARGIWKDQLAENGLQIHHHLQHKDTIDRPKVIGSIAEDDSYDAVFAVMPYNRISAILDSLAALKTPLVILVGNNMSPAEMEREIMEKTVCEKQVLFGFQSTAGKRDKVSGVLVCERAGAGAMDIGGLHEMPDIKTRAKLAEIFGSTGYALNWHSNMEAYLICHLAAVLPICYLAYVCRGDLRRSTKEQRKVMRLASREAYAMLECQGIPIIPKNDDAFYAPGPRGTAMAFLYLVMAKNGTIGDLLACEHCRNAYAEMEMLDKAFEKVISKLPDFPMPNWKLLKSQMPDWDQIREQYSGASRQYRGNVRLDSAKKTMKGKGFIKAELDKALPLPLSDELWQQSTDKLAEILEQFHSLPRGVHIHTDSFIFPSAAIYLTIKDVFGQEKAYSIIETAAISNCRGFSDKLTKMMKIPGMPDLFVTIWDPMIKKVFGAGNGFQNRFYPKEKGVYRADILACPYCRYMGELGCPELTKIFCENDDRIYGNLPGVKFERSGTLGKGADHCDFCIRRV